MSQHRSGGACMLLRHCREKELNITGRWETPYQTSRPRRQFLWLNHRANRAVSRCFGVQGALRVGES